MKLEENEDISYFLINILKIVYYLHVIFLFNMQSDDNNHDILSYRVIKFFIIIMQAAEFTCRKHFDAEGLPAVIAKKV